MGDVNKTEEMERLFSQDEVNTIVKDRLARERAKFESEFTEKESDLTRRENELVEKAFSLEANKVLGELRLPKETLELITTKDLEEFKTACVKLQGIIFQYVASMPIGGARPFDGRRAPMPDVMLEEVKKIME